MVCYSHNITHIEEFNLLNEALVLFNNNQTNLSKFNCFSKALLLETKCFCFIKTIAFDYLIKIERYLSLNRPDTYMDQNMFENDDVSGMHESEINNNYQSSFFYGFYYWAINKHKESHIYLKMAIGLNPNCEFSFRLLADISKEINVDNVAHGIKAVELNPSALNHYTLAVALSRNDCFKDALIEFQMAIYSDYRLKHAYLDIAICLENLNRTNESIYWIEQGLTFNPEEICFNYYLGYYQWKLMNYIEAVKYYDSYFYSCSNKLYSYNNILKFETEEVNRINQLEEVYSKLNDVDYSYILRLKSIIESKHSFIANTNKVANKLEFAIKSVKHEKLLLIHESLITGIRFLDKRDFFEANDLFNLYLDSGGKVLLRNQFIELLEVNSRESFSNNEDFGNANVRFKLRFSESKLLELIKDNYYPYNWMKIYVCISIFDFGKFKGKCVGEILISEPSYLVWCIKNLDNFVISNVLLIHENFTKRNDYIEIIEIHMLKMFLISSAYSKNEDDSYLNDKYEFRSSSNSEDDYFSRVDSEMVSKSEYLRMRNEENLYRESW